MSWQWLAFVVFAGFTVMVSVVPGILMVIRGRAPSAYRYVSVGWRWMLVDLTPDETRTVGLLRIAQGVLWPCAALIFVSNADEGAPAALPWLAAAAAALIFVWGIVLGQRVRGLPSVVETGRRESR